MEINPTELPIANEAETSSEVPALETAEGPFVAEEFLNGGEALQESVKEMEYLSQELVERVTADPLSASAAEQGALLGLSESETADALLSGGYAEKDQALCDKAAGLYANFRARLVRAAQIGVVALAASTGMPATADTEATNEQGINLQMTQTLEEKKMPETYEEVQEHLKGATLAPAESFAFLVRKQGDDAFDPVIVKRGASNNVPLTNEDDEKIAEAMESNTSDIEIVHTHPINESTLGVGGVHIEDEEVLRRGGTPRVAMSPSTTDLLGVAASFSRYPSAQLSGRVIDPAGEWEYGVSDSAAPFIKGVRDSYHEMEKINDVNFTPEEKSYLKSLNLENMHPQLLVNAISSHVGNDPIGQSVLKKIEQIKSSMSEIIGKNIDPDLESKFKELEGGWTPWVHPGTPEGDAEIARREKIAADLGFRMKYTPNPVVAKTEDSDDGIALRVSEHINPASLDAPGSEYPFIDTYGSQSAPNEDLSSDTNREER